ncbi:MAG TPA: PilC/PilY family type IV pilus protein [Desulfobacteraceae bacterium]|nr:PilC/PilY family type IV pilus protein [Desulfobacteraceae bacterium]HPJ67697.1 PilC/PilY family type IV pilus protein [Desulfobacteraceae bacterium]HPQ29574.1 PilC/PilY family type IV pilus protein [Desulfobacteraceae bacterium]
MKKILVLSMLVLAVFSTSGVRTCFAAEPLMSTYTSYPIFMVDSVTPNIMIILDNSGSMNFQAYYGAYDHTHRYYGYFEPYQKYSYASNVFTRNAAGGWDGNFLNWMTMRRVDIARKVLMGGLATARTGGGNQTNYGETPQAAGYDYTKTYDDTDDVTPFASGTSLDYLVHDGYFQVDAVDYSIRVQKDMTLPDEADNFVDGNISGVLQKVGVKARWGNMFFNFGTGSGQSGGSVAATIGTNVTSLITDLQNTGCDTWTPLAETYYVCMQYFMQEQVQSGLDYPNNVVPCSNEGDDPYYNGTEFVECAKSFAILLTDGASTMDMMIPAYLKDYDENKPNFGFFPDSGSSYLVDIALYARTNDLRPPGSKPNGEGLPDEQNLILYPIYAFGDDPQARQLIQAAAKNGGFDDRNGNNIPDLQAEWDKDGDGIPDNYFEATDGAELERALIQAIDAILARAAAGTALSVLATSAEGEGNIVQAYFRPLIIEDMEEIRWVGNLQSLWVDKRGYMREDTNGNHALDITVDKVIKYHVDGAGNTTIRRFDVSADAPYPDVDNDPYESLYMDEIEPIWEAGRALSLRSPDDRNIFTFIDKNNDKVVDESVADDPLDDAGELVRFHINGMSAIKPYLGVKDNTAWAYLGTTHEDRANNLIQFIRGNDSGYTGTTQIRSRTIGGVVNRLGDVVYSTPVSVSKPSENLDVIYSDESYQQYYNAYKNRETVIYVGANDGMLHAFTSWEYNKATKQFIKPAELQPDLNIGDELWAYIPQALLPHLKWLPSKEYTHVYYVDLKPRVADVQVFFDSYGSPIDDDHPGGWGTVLIGGLNTGGKNIPVTDDFDYDGATADTLRNFSSCYFAIDITKPREPKLLWEKTFDGLNLTTSYPTVLKVKDKWFAAFGSGPSDYDGSSGNKGHIFVVDVLSGIPYRDGTNDWLFQTGENGAFMSAPVSFDKNLNYSVDGIYIGQAYGTSGAIYKVTIPWVGTGNYGNSDTGEYIDDPNQWTAHKLFSSPAPVIASPTLSMDFKDNVWVYFGTGRYISEADKLSTQQQYFFGIKDPFFNEDRTANYLNYSAPLTLQKTDLFDADPYDVALNKKVYINGSLLDVTGEEDVYKFSNFVEWAQKKNGWFRSLEVKVSGPSERVLNKPVVFGGLVLSPAFVPNDDICSFGGDSFMYAFYFETGTAYPKKVFKEGTELITVDGGTAEIVLDRAGLGLGLASSASIHVGKESGSKLLVQQSTGAVVEVEADTALNVKSGLTSWIER